MRWARVWRSLRELTYLTDERADDVGGFAVGGFTGTGHLLCGYGEVFRPVIGAQAVGAAQALSGGSAVRFLRHAENVLPRHHNRPSKMLAGPHGI